jgi:hypothetical protein
MWLTDGDNLLVLRADANMKSIEIYTRTGMPTRSQTHEKSKSRRQSHHHVQLRTTVREKVPGLMWNEDAEDVIEDIDTLMEQSAWTEINRRHRFLINSTKEEFDVVCSQNDRAITKREFGIVLVHYFFCTAMIFSKSALATPQVSDGFNRARESCLMFLAPRAETWAGILRYRLTTTGFAANWNSTPRERRDTAEMRALINRSELFRSLNALSDLMPKNHRAPFSALAVASRLKERTRYSDLWRRLVRAASQFKHPDKVQNDAFFDDDFDDFRHWAMQHPDEYK